MSPKRCWTGAPKPPKTLKSMPPPYIADQSQIGTSKGLFFIVATATAGDVTEILLERAAKPQRNLSTMEATTTVRISVPDPQQTYQGVSLPAITDRGQIIFEDEVLSTTEAITTVESTFLSSGS